MDTRPRINARDRAGYGKHDPDLAKAAKKGKMVTESAETAMRVAEELDWKVVRDDDQFVVKKRSKTPGTPGSSKTARRTVESILDDFDDVLADAAADPGMGFKEAASLLGGLQQKWGRTVISQNRSLSKRLSLAVENLGKTMAKAQGAVLPSDTEDRHRLYRAIGLAQSEAAWLAGEARKIALLIPGDDVLNPGGDSAYGPADMAADNFALAFDFERWGELEDLYERAKKDGHHRDAAFRLVADEHNHGETFPKRESLIRELRKAILHEESEDDDLDEDGPTPLNKPGHLAGEDAGTEGLEELLYEPVLALGELEGKLRQYRRFVKAGVQLAKNDPSVSKGERQERRLALRQYDAYIMHVNRRRIQIGKELGVAVPEKSPTIKTF